MLQPDPTTAARCAHRIRAIYASDLADEAGVLHAAAVGRDRAGRLCSIAIDDAAPRSATDAFLLDLARARADAIVATGRSLRREPTLTHALGAAAPGLRGWRREVLGKRRPPLSVVLTRARRLDLDHPLFATSPRVIVFTDEAGARRLGRTARAAVEIVGSPTPTLRSAIDWLRRERGCATIDVEAGPSTTAALYGEPVAVDELMLSVYEAAPLARDRRAGRFTDEARLRALFEEPAAPFSSLEESGRWSFHRLVRRQRG